MSFSENEANWIKWVSGKKIDIAAVNDQIAHDALKQKVLDENIRQRLDEVRDEIDEAQGIVVKKTKDPGALKAAWRQMTGSDAKDVGEMKWRADDSDTNKGLLSKYELRADVEVDTIADINEKTQNIDPKDLIALTDSFQRIKEMEKTMRLQFDDKGNPLFTDEDIRNELWTPLVRSGLIPENMVPDDFSEHAIAFKGAQELYGDKLAAYTATHTKTQDNLAFGLRIAKETVTVTGAIVSGSFQMKNATDVAAGKTELNELKEQKEVLKGQNPPGDTAAVDAQIATKDKQVRELENIPRYIDAGTALLNGGLSMTELAIEHKYAPKDQDKWAKWAQTLTKGLEIAQGMAVKSATAGILAGSQDGGKSEAGFITCITCSLNAGFAGARLVPAAYAIWKEPDEAKRAAMIAGAVGTLAGAVADSINAAASQINTVDKNATAEKQAEQKQADKDSKAQLALLANGLKVAITQAGNGPAIVAAYKRGDTKALGMLLGGAAVAAALAPSSEAIFDAMHKDVSAEENYRRQVSDTPIEGNYLETTGANQEASQDAAAAKAMDAINSSVSGVQKINMAQIKPNLPTMDPASVEELQKLIDAEVDAKQQELAEKELKDALSPAVVQEMFDDVDAEVGAFEETYSKAFPDTGITSRTPQEIADAGDAIDRAMANTAALRQKVALINGLSGGAAGVIVALVPGASAVASMQALVRDIYTLVKCVEVHNTWCDSMDVAMAGQGGAAAAIQNTVRNAKIHLSQAAIVAILSALKASSDVARMFDPSGVATAVSAGASMASAVVNFAYKMQKEAEIKIGWATYKDARSNPGNRKAARKALRLNSTLAKCCIAYGAAIQGDTAAKQAIKATGLTITALQNDKDICVRLVAYLENELVDDPTVLAVDYQKNNKWAPGKPALELANWTMFKATARKSATPLLNEASTSTPAIDRLLANLAQVPDWGETAKFDGARSAKAAQSEEGVAKDFPGKHQAVLDRLETQQDILDRLEAAYSAYQPMNEAGSDKHDGMAKASKTYAAIAKAGSKVVTGNITALKAYPELVA
ncbi:hypothetical protein FEE96_20355 [Parasedimentitalea maritima]|uniref:Uncharacterized protein n=1 Tax=Parasedimentitalea maritima TaxID=2578117 RepID=A0ABY2URF5_9RHOB|nr:hypothetical protein [Zongyanglinia marina]TLP56797.1 hypothetical protein FEE96_20355 [Zongyanglinia marina]